MEHKMLHAHALMLQHALLAWLHEVRREKLQASVRRSVDNSVGRHVRTQDTGEPKLAATVSFFPPRHPHLPRTPCSVSCPVGAFLPPPLVPPSPQSCLPPWPRPNPPPTCHNKPRSKPSLSLPPPVLRALSQRLTPTLSFTHPAPHLPQTTRNPSHRSASHPLFSVPCPCPCACPPPCPASHLPQTTRAPSHRSVTPGASSWCAP